MVDERLVSYINSALARGLSIREIKGALINSGWDSAKIDYIINSMGISDNMSKEFPSSNENPREKPSNKIFWFLGILFILIIAGIVVWFLFFSDKETGNSSSTPENTGGAIEMVLCDNADCIIESSGTCEKANLTNTATVNFLGLDITTTSYTEISGEQGELCVLKLRTEEQHINYSAELVQQMLDGGATQEEINLQEQISNEDADTLEGRGGICKFTNNNLTIFLTKWFSGSFEGSQSCTLVAGEWDCTYSGDWSLAESCEGEYFSSDIS